MTTEATWYLNTYDGTTYLDFGISCMYIDGVYCFVVYIVYIFDIQRYNVYFYTSQVWLSHVLLCAISAEPSG